MEQERIYDSNHKLYNDFKRLYSQSFPIFEQRTETQQEYAFNNENYHLIGYCSEGSFIEFISFWEFKDYLYIEHFAINNEIRGKGYGSTILNKFIKSTPKTILLEIDPIIDDISNARLRFYKRCGFWENPYSHTHPSYRDEYQPHHLIVLTTGKQLSEDEYQTFYKDLSVTVMKRLK